MGMTGYLLENINMKYKGKEQECGQVEGDVKRVIKTDSYGYLGDRYKGRIRDMTLIMKSIKKYKGLVACIYCHEAFIYY